MICSICNDSGHVMRGRFAVRCQCLQLKLLKTYLGPFFTTPAPTSTLQQVADKDLLISGPLDAIRPHVARVLLDDQQVGRSYISMDAYRLIEIYLQKDEEMHTLAPVTDTDRIIILLGFGDPPNRYLPELILQVISRRSLIFKPTWVILGLPVQQIGAKYNSELAEKLATFKKVEVR